MTRSTRNKAFAVGLLVAVCGVAFLIAFTFFRKGGYSEKDTYVVFAYYEDATGLTWKSRVQIAGIPVGEVSRILLEGNRARLDLRIQKEIDVRADACVTKRFPSTLLPDALIELTPGTLRYPSLRDLPPEQRELKCVQEGTSIAKLLDSLSKIATDVQRVTGELQGLVAGSQGSIKNIIANVESASARLDRSLEEGQGKIQQILDNAESFTGTLAQVASADKERYRSIARNVDEASARLNQVLQSVQGFIGEPGTGQGGEIRQSVNDVRESLSKLNRSMDEIQKIVTDIGQGKGVAGKLLADERLGNKVGTALEQASDYVDRLSRLQIQVQLRSEWYYNQTGAKTYAGLTILPRPDKYYIFQVVSDPRGVNTQTAITQTTETPTGTVETRTLQTVNQAQGLTFSFEFGKRWGPLALRIGLIESSGGAGADLFLLNDSLKISAEIYQFSRTVSNVALPAGVRPLPRAKIWADYTFLKHFYVTVGSDDFLNRWRANRFPAGAQFNIGSDIFFGAGIVYTDDDLKTLFGVGGGSVVAAGAASANK